MSLTIIRGGNLVYGQGVYRADIAVDEGVIAHIEPEIEPAAGDRVMDADGCLVFPGFIDPHTHFDLSTGACVTADDFASGSRAAIAGGTTTVIDYATQDKGKTLYDALVKWVRKAEGVSSCDYAFHMAITDWNGRTQEDLLTMFEMGVTTFKAYMAYDALRVNDAELLEILRAVDALGGLVGVHCENGTLVNHLIARELAAGRRAPSAHPRSRPPELEAEAISRLTYLARLIDCPVAVVHISSLLGLREVEKARALGVTVVAETCPQYLLLTEEVYRRPRFEGAKFVCSPPIRRAGDRAALISAVGSGQIDTIATDHCSFNFAGQKALGRRDFSRIPNGLPGVEHRAQLFYSEFVKPGLMPPEAMCRLLSENAARRYGLYPQKGVLAVGSDADIVIWEDCDAPIRAETQVQRVDYTPYEGYCALGRARAVLLRGQLVAEKGRPVPENGNLGRYVPRSLPEFGSAAPARGAEDDAWLR